MILGDQKRLVVDAFARYRIVDPLRFYQSVGTEGLLRGRIDTILDASLRKVLGEVPLFTVLSADRAALMNEIRDQANAEAKQFGIDIVDVRIKRADLPAENSQAIYRRMQTEREREAKELRAQGAELAQRIRSRADRERRVIIAEAEKEGADHPRRGRCAGGPDLRRRVRPGRRVLQLLPLDAGLSRRARRRQHERRAVAGQRVLPLLRRPRGRSCRRRSGPRSEERAEARDLAAQPAAAGRGRPSGATRRRRQPPSTETRAGGRGGRAAIPAESRPNSAHAPARRALGNHAARRPGGRDRRQPRPCPRAGRRVRRFRPRSLRAAWRMRRRQRDDRSGDGFGPGAGAGGAALGGVAEQHEARRRDSRSLWPTSSCAWAACWRSRSGSFWSGCCAADAGGQASGFWPPASAQD